MFAVYADSFSNDDPLSALQVGERPDPEVPDGWTTVTVKAASLNHHDLCSLRGVGLREEALPMILGCDAAGLDEDGNEVVVHAVISDPSWTGDETFDPKRSLLSERYQGTLRRQGRRTPRATWCRSRRRCPSRRPPACRPRGSRRTGCSSPAASSRPATRCWSRAPAAASPPPLITLGRAAGLRVLATSRDEAKRARALELGAHEVFESGARLPVKVDAVMETVGRATWSHSIRALRPGGRIVTSGTTSGPEPRRRRADPDLLPAAERDRLDDGHPRRAGLAWSSMLDATGARPLIDRTLPMTEARDGFAAMAGGDQFGKIVFTR